MVGLLKIAKSQYYITMAFGLLFIFVGVYLVLLMDNLHFNGESYEYFRIPFYNDLFHGIIGAINRGQRIGRELIWVVFFEILGFDRRNFHLFVIFSHIISSIAFGLCVLRAFPRRPVLGVGSALVAFTLPTSTALTYYAMNPSPVSMFFVWLSILSFQSWAKNTNSILLLVIGCGFYIASFTIYENGVLFIFAAPLFVIPILAGKRAEGFDGRISAPLVKLGVAVSLAFLFVLGLRYVLQFGDVASTVRGVPSVERVVGSIRTLGEYVFTAAWDVPLDRPALVMGIIFWVSGGGLLLRLANRSDREASATATPPDKGWYIALLGITLFALGITPYFLAGNAAQEITWGSNARIFSSAGYGLAVLLALVPAAVDRPIPSKLLRVALVGIAALWVAFWFGLRQDWEAAAAAHCQLWQGFLEQVPRVSGDTTFLFADLRHRIGVAPVFGGTDSLMVLMQMIFLTPEMRGREQIYAYHMETVLEAGGNERAYAVVSREGVTTRTSKYHTDKPFPLDSIILVARTGNKLAIVDKITSASHGYAVSWRGVAELRTNFARILPAQAGAPFLSERLKRVGIRCDR